MIHADETYEYPHSDRTVVIGDIHGDIKRFKRILIDAGIINNSLEWIAVPCNTIVLQVGDQIDSLNRAEEIEQWEVLQDVNMLYFSNSLNKIAMTKGGRVISLVGNHELMNVMGNFSYVSPNSLFPYRRKFFEPQGTLSQILSEMKICVKIGTLVFCHAGIRRAHLDFLQERNKSVSCLNALWRNFIKKKEIGEDDVAIFNRIIASDEGILWTRELDTHDDLDYVLKSLGCVYMFVGHTPSDRIQLVHSKIWYTDSGISRAFGSKSYQYIDIVAKAINIKTVSDA